MPFYTIINKVTKETREEFMMISDLDQFEKDLPPDEEILCGAPGVAYRHGTKVKGVDNEFKDRLREIKKSHFGSTLDIN